MIKNFTNKLQIKPNAEILTVFVIFENSHNFDQENASWK